MNNEPEFDTNGYNSLEYFNKLVEKHDIEVCPICGAYSAYANQDVNMMQINGGFKRYTNQDGLSDGNEEYTNNEILTNWPNVYHIGACSCFEWQCGNCKNSFSPVDSPINAECYTHVDYSQLDE